jgi:hypothetical protein
VVLESAAFSNSLKTADFTDDALLAKVVAVVTGLTLVVSIFGLEWASWEASVGETWDLNANTVVLSALEVTGNTLGALGDSSALVDCWWAGESGGSGDEKGGDGEELHFDCLWRVR